MTRIYTVRIAIRSTGLRLTTEHFTSIRAAMDMVEWVAKHYLTRKIVCELNCTEYFTHVDDDGEEYEVEAVETLLWW